MGINFGQRRNRLELLDPGKNGNQLVGYALSRDNIKFEHFDEQQVADIVNRQYDRVEERIRRIL